MADNDMADDEKPEYWPEGTTAGQALIMLLAPQFILLCIALWSATFLGVDPIHRFSLSIEAVVLGAGVSLVLIIAVFGSRFLLPRIWLELEDRAVSMFANAPFQLSWGIILLLSLIAGVFEEIVFRGALQGYLETIMPFWSAIALQAILFAALHPISKAYVAYVFIIGVILGWIFASTNNLLVVMVAHFLYDVYALERLRRLAEREALSGTGSQ